MELYLYSAGVSFLSVPSSTSLSRAAAKGGGRTVPATSCHCPLKWCWVKCCGCHILACRLIQTGKRFLKDNTGFVSLALFSSLDSSIELLTKKESKKLLRKPKKTFSHLLLSYSSKDSKRQIMITRSSKSEGLLALSVDHASLEIIQEHFLIYWVTFKDQWSGFHKL